MPRELSQSVVVVTGASSGIGRATALAFARAGASVVLTARRVAPLQAAAAECERLGSGALAVPADVRDAAALERVAAEAQARFRGLDVWVNNAGVTLLGRFEDAPGDLWREVLETNFFGAVNGARVALPHLRRRGGGTLINVGSVNSRVGAPYASAYVASKFAIRGFAECQRDEAAIVRCAKRPRREIVVGFSGRQLIALHDLALPLFGRVMSRTVEREHFLQRPADPSPGNLREPVPDWTGVTGGWKEGDASPDGTGPALSAMGT